MSTRISIDPFNRIEGDLRIELEIDNGCVTAARSSGIVFRGFERIMPGRDPMDALVITPRICGICSGSHGVAAAKTLAQALDARMPENAFYMRNLILGTEVIMSHLSHFYLLFLPDLTNAAFSDRPFYREACERFTAFKGSSVARAVRARQSALEIMGLVAGKWPNTLSMHPSGTTSTLNLSSLTRAIGILQEFTEFLEKHLLAGSLEEWLDIDSFSRLEQWLDNGEHDSGDLTLFLSAALDIGLDRLGKGTGRFLSYGGYDLPDGSSWVASGYFDKHLFPFDQEKITECISASFFRDAMPCRHPLGAVTTPCAEKDGAYSWAKAPRYNGKTVEVGPLARMVVGGDPLIADLREKTGDNALTRMLARLQELLRLSRQLQIWLAAIQPVHPFYQPSSSHYRESGIGLTEAARGSLGHWMKTASNLINSYQVITPSAWNMSPRDAEGVPGPVEQALEGVQLKDQDNPIEINLIVRSFDPCMSCTVH
jgi:Ni,Fe-hydrogenase I large subunit